MTTPLLGKQILGKQPVAGRRKHVPVEGVTYENKRCFLWVRAAIVSDRPILSSERMLYKDYNRKCSVEKNTGRGSQGAGRREELSSGKPPVVK
jgi:hypothetical protein